MNDTRPPLGATSSMIDAQLDQQPAKQAPTTMTDTHQLSNTATPTPTTDAPLVQPSPNDTVITTNAQSQCVLFRLPRELRDSIYEHVFSTNTVRSSRNP
jgi:hypothetical protein